MDDPLFTLEADDGTEEHFYECPVKPFKLDPGLWDVLHWVRTYRQHREVPNGPGFYENSALFCEAVRCT